MPATGVDDCIIALVLAAGAGRRFGGAKQLARIDGRPLLERPLRALAAAGGIAETIVTLGAHGEQVRAAVDLHGARVVAVPDWQEGIAASLRAGVAAAGEVASLRAGVEAASPEASLRAGVEAASPEASLRAGSAGKKADALLVVLGDQAWLRAEHVERLLAAARAAPDAPAVRAVHDGRPGHPVLLRRPLFPALAALRGDRGAGALLRESGAALEVELGAAAVADVDFPHQLDDARADAPRGDAAANADAPHADAPREDAAANADTPHAAQRAGAG